MDRMRRRNLYRLFALVALGFGSVAALLTKFGAPYTLHIVFILWAVAFLAGVAVLRSKV